MHPIRRGFQRIRQGLENITTTHSRTQPTRGSQTESELQGRKVTNSKDSPFTEIAKISKRIEDLNNIIKNKNSIIDRNYIDKSVKPFQDNSIKDIKKEYRRLKFTLPPLSTKNRKGLKNAKRALKEVIAAKRELANLELRRNGHIAGMQIVNSDIHHNDLEALRYRLSLGASNTSSEVTETAIEINLENFSSKDIQDLTKYLESNPDTLATARSSLELKGTEPRLAFRGRLSATKADALHEFADKVLTYPKLISIENTLIPDGKEGQQVLETLTTGGQPIGLDDSGKVPSHVVCLKCNSKQLQQLDDLEITDDDPSINEPQTVQSLSARSDARMTTFKFAEKFKETGRDFNKAADDPSQSAGRAIKVTETSAEMKDQVTSDEDTHIGSYSKDFGVVGEFQVSSNSMVNKGGGGNKSKCEDYVSLSSFPITVGGKSTECVLPAAIDGHGGHKAAKFTQENLGQKIQEQLAPLGNLNVDTAEGRQAISRAIKVAFRELESDYKSQKGPTDTSGTDLSCPVIIGGYIFTATLGDCRTLMVPLDNSQQAAFLTPDTSIEQEKFALQGVIRGHALTSKEEQGIPEWRLKAEGGKSLPTSRSIGDSGFNTSPIPVVTCTKVPEGGCILLAMTDGTTDLTTGQALADYAYDGIVTNRQTPALVNQGLQQKSSHLTSSGDDRGTNITVIRPNEL